MGTAQVQGIHQPLRFLLGERYRHVNFRMTEKWPLDAVEHIPELFRVGKQRAAETYDMINSEFFQHRRMQYSPIISSENEIVTSEFGLD